MDGGAYPTELELPQGNFQILDLVAKRNVVFVSWQLAEDTGTWIMGFERDGTLTQFTPVP